MAISTAAAVIGSSVLGAGASLFGASKQGKAAQSAANTEAGAANYAAELQLQGQQDALAQQREMFDLSRGDMEPFRQFEVGALPFRQSALQYEQDVRAYGQNALHRFAVEMGKDFETSPGYQFRRDEGLKAVQNSAAARGMLKSGATLKGIQRFGDNLAADEHGTYMNRLASIAGMGPTGATSGTGQGSTMAGANAAMQTGANMGNTLMAGANGRASSYMAGGQARANGIMAGGNAFAQGAAGVGNAASSGINNMLLFQYLNRTPQIPMPGGGGGGGWGPGVGGLY